MWWPKTVERQTGWLGIWSRPVTVLMAATGAVALAGWLAVQPSRAATAARSVQELASPGGAPPAQPPAPQKRATQVSALSDDGGTSTSSNAGNYGHDARLSVNQRTAELTLDAELAGIPGISDDVSVSVTLSYSSADATSDLDSNVRYFGLPYGLRSTSVTSTTRAPTRSLNVDGTQSYTLDPNWRTLFTPTGSTDAASALTGLLQYNRADVNFRTDAGTVTVGGIASAYVFATLDGMSKLLLAARPAAAGDRDRFGNAHPVLLRQPAQPTRRSAHADRSLIVDIVGQYDDLHVLRHAERQRLRGRAGHDHPARRPTTVAWVAAGRRTASPRSSIRLGHGHHALLGDLALRARGSSCSPA